MTSKLKGIKLTQAVTFNEKSYDAKTTYYLTEKLDGKRAVALIKGDSVVVYDKKYSEIKKYTAEGNKIKFTVIDGEFYNNHFYAFDIIFSDGVDIRDIKYSERLIHLIEIVQNYKVINLKNIVKTDKTNIYKVFKIIYEHIHPHLSLGNVDGIVFIPDKGYSEPSLKWKPTGMLTVDFKIKKAKDDVIMLEYPGKSGDYPGIKFEIKNKNWHKFLKNRNVLEVFMVDKVFYPLRLREDKKHGNSLETVTDNINTILNPPDMTKILTK